MEIVPIPVLKAIWELGFLKAKREVVRGMLGEPHFVETDTLRTYGGEEEVWAFALNDEQLLVVVFRVPYDEMALCSDINSLEPALVALKINPADPQLIRHRNPVPIQ